ncbi:outer membrane protein assembly factor BamA [Rhodovulum sp. DZ06]|uniref:outer membrane protein assembly factor BamA n=1 Tax=Rhodovulum sp. DZ06 TaxID=3425126 RepID=UPI003D34C6C2
MATQRDRNAPRRGRAARMGAPGALRLCAALAVAAFGALAVPAPAAAQDEPVVERVERILVEGARRVDENTVKAYMAVQEGEPATPAAINESVRRLFDTGLFENVVISPLADGLLVQVEEAAYINRVVFEGWDEVDEGDLRGVIRSAPRNAFSRATADADARAILELYRRTGRFGARVEPKIIRRDNNRVDLVFEIEEGERTGVRDISFVGNRRFSDRTLRGAINTQESGFFGWLFASDTYDPDKLEFDKELLRRFYLENGHADFEVLSATAELTPDREDFVITFTVEEGEVYEFGVLSVETSLQDLDPEALQALIVGDEGDAYDARDVDDTVEALTFEAGKSGYAFIDVRPRPRKDPEAKTVDITYVLEEGPRVYVERIDIEGNTRTQDRVLRRQFSIAEGDAFNVSAVQRARGRLRALGYFSDVQVTTARGSADDRAVVTVEVEEQLTGSISFGLGYSSADGPVGDITISERNFLGRGQTISGRVNISGDEQAVTFAFTEPALLERDLAASLGIGWTMLDRSDEASFEETNLFLRPTLEFPVAPDQRLQLRLLAASDEIRDVAPAASPSILADEGRQTSFGFGASWELDQRNDPVEPTEGYRLRFSQDFASRGGGGFVSSTASAKGWTSFARGDVVATLELESGALFSIGEPVRITDRYFLGGDSFRGFQDGGIGPRDTSVYDASGLERDDSLGGKYFGVIRADVSFPLGLPEELGIYGGLFADAGSVWGLDDTVFVDSFYPAGSPVVIDDGMDFRASVGASIFIDSAFGPLRFNFAYPLVKEEQDETEFFRFTVGTRF